MEMLLNVFLSFKLNYQQLKFIFKLLLWEWDKDRQQKMQFEGQVSILFANMWMELLNYVSTSMLPPNGHALEETCTSLQPQSEVKPQEVRKT